MKKSIHFLRDISEQTQLEVRHTKSELDKLSRWCKVENYNFFDDRILQLTMKGKEVEEQLSGLQDCNSGTQSVNRKLGKHHSVSGTPTEEWTRNLVNCISEAKKELDGFKEQLGGFHEKLTHVEQIPLQEADANPSVSESDVPFKDRLEEVSQGVQTCIKHFNTMDKTVSDVQQDLNSLKEKLKQKARTNTCTSTPPGVGGVRRNPFGAQGNESHSTRFTALAQPQSEDAKQTVRKIEEEMLQYMRDRSKSCEDRRDFLKKLNLSTHPDKTGGSHEAKVWFQQWQVKYKDWFIEGFA